MPRSGHTGRRDKVGITEGLEQPSQAMVCLLRIHREAQAGLGSIIPRPVLSHTVQQVGGPCELKFGGMHSIFASRFQIIKNIYLDNAW